LAQAARQRVRARAYRVEDHARHGRRPTRGREPPAVVRGGDRGGRGRDRGPLARGVGGGALVAPRPRAARGPRSAGAEDGRRALLHTGGRTAVPRRAPERAVRLRRGPELAILYRPRRPPYGGSNQFLLALRGELRRRGLRVSEKVGRSTRACLLHAYLVDLERLRKRLSTDCRVVHRVDGPIGLYRGRDDGSDRRIVEIN